MAQNPDPSKLDFEQILPRVFDGANDRLRVDAEVTANISGAQEVIIDEADDSIAVYGTDGAVNRQLKTDSDGQLQVDVISSALPDGAATETTLSAIDSNIIHADTDDVTIVASALPTGAATEAKQDAGNASLVSIDSDIDVALSTRSSEATLSSLNAKFNSLGQKTMANSAPVVIASDQTVIPVSDNGGSLTVDGTVAATQSGTWNINDISGTVSLPTGASTAANQITANNSLASIDAGIPTALGQTTMSASMPIVIASDQSAVAGNITQVGGSSLTLGQKTSANSIPVTFASDQSSSIVTYSASTSFTLASTASDAFVIQGSGTKTIKVRRLVLGGTNTGNTNAAVYLVKRSTANSGGTSSTPTIVPHDSTFATATAVVTAYTANPTPGTSVGTLKNRLIFLPTLGSTNVSQAQIFQFGDMLDCPIVLRGTAQSLAVNFNGASITGTTVLYLSIEWTEE